MQVDVAVKEGNVEDVKQLKASGHELTFDHFLTALEAQPKLVKFPIQLGCPVDARCVRESCAIEYALGWPWRPLSKKTGSVGTLAYWSRCSYRLHRSLLIHAIFDILWDFARRAMLYELSVDKETRTPPIAPRKDGLTILRALTRNMATPPPDSIYVDVIDMASPRKHYMCGNSDYDVNYCCMTPDQPKHVWIFCKLAGKPQ